MGWQDDVERVAIERQPADTAWVDVMDGDARRQVRLHNHGLLALVDAMPRLVPNARTADAAVVQAARVSYGTGTKQVHEDRGLIRYLMRHHHTTPFEMVEFKFHVVAPLFVARQWVRHRTASVNEYSARYSVVQDRFYRPDADGVRLQSVTNRQGGESLADPMTAEQFLAYLDRCEALYADYEQMLEQNVSREMARIGLPLSLYTEWYWKIDLHNLLHFLTLRMDEHAQREIRDYARAMFALIRPIVPLSAEAFVDYRLESVSLSRLEIEAMHHGRPLESENKREQAEWAAKRQQLGLGEPSA